MQPVSWLSCDWALTCPIGQQILP